MATGNMDGGAERLTHLGHVVRFFDLHNRRTHEPLLVWGSGNTQVTGGERTADPCTQHSGEGETRVRAVLMPAGVQGGILAAAALGIWGMVRSRRVALTAAGCLMLLEMFPTIFSIWPLALLAGLGFLTIACRMPD